MNYNTFKDLYFGDFKPTEEEIYLDKLAEEYARVTEEYDRSVCTGPIINNSILPANRKEFALINKNAHKVMKDLAQKALAEKGISFETLRKAIYRKEIAA